LLTIQYFCFVPSEESSQYSGLGLVISRDILEYE